MTQLIVKLKSGKTFNWNDVKFSLVKGNRRLLVFATNQLYLTHAEYEEVKRIIAVKK